MAAILNVDVISIIVFSQLISAYLKKFLPNFDPINSLLKSAAQQEQDEQQEEQKYE